VLPQASLAWGLTASEAGWIGSIYFAGYAAAVPILAGATDRVDGRWIVAGSSLLGAAASLAFAFVDGNFWLALAIRFAGGVALAGVHMPGLGLLSERLEGPAQSRGAALYTSSYAIGSAGSFLIAGAVEAWFGWRAVFVAGAVGPLLALAAIMLVSPVPPRRAPAAPPAERFASVWRNRPFMAYAVGFAGNTWEVFAIRVWFVACLAWTLSLPGNAVDLPNLALLAGVASLAGVPASIVVAELSAKGRRAEAIVLVCAISVATCLALAATAGGDVWIVLTLLVLLQILSFADVGALGAGAITHAAPAYRGAALAVYALMGFTTGFVGPAVVGLVLDSFGGVESRAGWTAAFLVMALGSTVAGCAVWTTRRRAD
jgi:MFS family permease